MSSLSHVPLRLPAIVSTVEGDNLLRISRLYLLDGGLEPYMPCIPVTPSYILAHGR